MLLTFIDIDYFILPNIITYPGMILGLTIATLNHFFNILDKPFCPDLYSALLGLSGAFFLFLVSEVYLRLRKKEGLGMGDVKLLAMVGLCFGWQASFYTIFIGSITGTFFSIILLIFNRHKMSSPLPFGPYLNLGTLLYLFYFYFNNMLFWYY